MTCTYSPEAYVFGSEENHALLEAETNELLHFGHNFPAPQGGSYWLDDTGNPDLTQNIHTWITCRMAHVYSLGFLHGEPGAAELVDKAIAGLRGPLHDDENGGWYPSISADGSTHEAGKVCYAHAFVILAATSAKLIGRPDADELLEEALATYDKHFWDDEIGLAVDTWNTEFTELDPYRGINANMHTTEAFLAGCRCDRQRGIPRACGPYHRPCGRLGVQQQLAHSRAFHRRLAAGPRMQPRQAG